MPRFLIICVAIALLIYLWQHKHPLKAVVEMAKGIVPDNPQDLADASGVDLEIYSLARVGQSEENLSSDRAKIAVMCAARNHARRQGKTITEIVTRGNPERSDYAQANGRYGRQGIHPYCTTILPPTANTLRLASEVYYDEVEDETQGAQWFDNPRTQDLLAKAYPKKDEKKNGKGYYTSAQIAERRQAKGLRMVIIPGIGTRFWV